MEPSIDEVLKSFRESCKYIRQGPDAIDALFSKLDIENWLKNQHAIISPSSLATKCLIKWLSDKSIIQEAGKYRFLGKVQHEVAFTYNGTPITHSEAILKLGGYGSFGVLKKIITITTEDPGEARKLLD